MSVPITWTDLEIVILSKSGKDKYDITYMWNLKGSINEHIYKIEIES